ncbi:MAG: T9SS type A sorting domain-containing protein, partial [Bacteroidota bacterium]
TALPVSWLSFGAHAGAKQVKVQWETTEEPDNAGFHVERSVDGSNWSVIGQVAARAGANQFYSYPDLQPLRGTSYYRLRQTDYDGQISYSPVATVNFLADNNIHLFPNPATDLIKVQLPEDGVVLGLRNVAGQIAPVRFQGQEGQLTAHIGALPAGIYFLQVQLTDGVIRGKRLVVH